MSDPDGEGCGPGPGNKKGDDEIVDGQREREQRPRRQAGPEHRQHDPARGRPPACAQVPRGFDDGVVEVLEPGQDGHGDEAHAEGDMGEEDGEQPEPDPGGDKEHEQADADQDLGGHERRVDQDVMKTLEAAPGETIEGESRDRAQDEGHGGRPGGDQERGAGGAPDLGLAEELFVPDSGRNPASRSQSATR